MSQASLIINVAETEHQVSLGLAGQWLIKAKQPGEKFSLLVVLPTVEIQDIGDNRRINHLLKSLPIARDIAGLTSDATAHTMGSRGGREKWGVLLCAAQPDLPKELIAAMEEEIEYLNINMPDVKYKRDNVTKATVAVNVEEPSVKKMKEKLSYAVQSLRREFEDSCRGLVKTSEIAQAHRSMQIEDQRLVAEADRMWARPQEQNNINEIHRVSCARLGQERPWCYVALQLVDCPGCGSKIKENILLCPKCNGWLDKGIDVLSSMPPHQRAIAMYPERDAEAAAPAGGRK